MALADEVAPPQQGRSRDKLARLLAAGRELFAEHGFDGTRMSDVAERAGCSVGVAYQRFKDKDTFFAAVQQAFLDEVVAARAEMDSHADSLSAAGLLRAHVGRVVAVFRENAGLMRAFFHYEITHPGVELPATALIRAAADQLARAVLNTGEHIDHPQPELAVAMAAHVVRSALIDQIIHGSGPIALDDDRIIDELTRLAVAYLGLHDEA